MTEYQNKMMAKLREVPLLNDVEFKPHNEDYVYSTKLGWNIIVSTKYIMFTPRYKGMYIVCDDFGIYPHSLSLYRNGVIVGRLPFNEFIEVLMND